MGIEIGQQRSTHHSTSKAPARGLFGWNGKFHAAVGTLIGLMAALAETALQTVAIATPITAATTAGEMIDGSIVLEADPLALLKVDSPDRTNAFAPSCPGCNAMYASALDTRLPFATCLRLLSSWINTPRPTCQMHNNLKLNRTGLLAGRKNLGALVGRLANLCGRIA
jgi:hypothetical protein